MSGPLTSILGAFEDGARSIAQVASTTGLDEESVRAGIDHLVRVGRIEAKELAAGCPGGGCGSCASATLDGAPGCGASGPSAVRSGPALVTLTLRRREQS